jgi:DHA3 family macrolide efflux protein-like MFS transporter
MTMDTATPNHPSSNWKRPFFIVWTGQVFSLLGSGLVQFALVWWLTQTTGSAVVLATSTLAAILPGVFLGPFAGALVDRWNRRLVMIVADSAIAVSTIFLALLYWWGVIQPWHVFVILFLRSLGGVFHYNAMSASTSLMVPEKHLARIAGLNQTLQGVLNIATPPLGAMLLGLLEMYYVLAIDVVTAAIAVTALFFVAIPQPTRKEPAAAVTPHILLRDVGEGLRYVMAWPGLVAILVMAMVINFLFVPASTLMPLLITNHFQGTAWHLGIMESFWGIGAVAGGLVLSVWGGFRRKIFTSMTGLIGMGVGALLTGMAPESAFVMAVAGYAFAGFMNPITNGPLLAFLQSRVAPEMQGRVFSLVQSGCGAMMPLGTLVAAPVANWLGIPAWFIAAGLVTAFMGLLGFSLPVVANIERDMKPITESAAIPGGAVAQEI